MKKSLNWFLVGALLVTGGLAMSARAQSSVVYAAEYNQSTNRFGTIDLLNGNFTKISSFGNVLINDIAYCPTNGTLYGISNTTALVAFNKTNGVITTIGNLVSGIESLAFRPSDGALFGATSSKLYTVNPVNGTATLVGSYGSPTKLGTTGQNIRFAQDGNLYVSNTSTNTDIYRINTTNGAATWMGEAVGYPYLILMNASSNMYGVYINLGTSTNPVPKLATFDLGSFVNGGTNANGSTHQVAVILVGAGTNFPANFNFSGNVPQAITNLTVPVSASGPSNQTTVVGSNVVFSTVASGTGPYNYAWSKNGTAISGQTNSSLTLNNVTTSDAAAYSVIVGGAIGTATNSATLTVTKAVATVTLGSLNQTYDGSAKTATATTTPGGLTVTFTYNGSANAPTNAGSYTVIGTINDANYTGSATNTLVISKASSAIALGSLNQTYDGSAKAATATTTPGGLAVSFTYNGSATVPTGAGSYTVVGTINDANYQGSATGTLVISKGSGAVSLGSLNQTFDGSAKAATATTTPGGLAVTFTYNGSATVPTGAGSYTVVGTINDANYQGSATGTLVISKASGAVALGSLSQTYDGTAKAATATTTPGGLAVTFTYNGSATIPTSAGSYTVVGTINDANYQGSATGTLVISKASGAVALGSLNQTYDGSAKAATATTTPGGLAVSFTYNGSATVPTGAGSYAVVGTINDANYQGNATGTLVIDKASAAVTLGSLSQTYDSTAKAATATTTPTGLTVSFTYNGSATIPTSAGSYTVVGTINDANYQGSATGTLVISKASGAVALGSLNQTYDGSAKAATATTTPGGLAVSFTYNGSATVPTGAGSYAVVGTINDANYQGNATGTLVIDKASAAVTLGSLSQTYDSTAKAATATTTPTGLTVSFTYNGSATVPISAGSYTVVGTINDANYQGSATGTLVISKGSGAVSLGSLNQTFDGSAKAATATTTPGGLAVTFTYNGSATVPTGAGSYTVVGTINDANYQGSATGTLVISKASGAVALSSLSQTYDGSAKAATATTTPGGLAVSFTYNGSATVPTGAGSYTVVGTINDANYQGSATGTLVISKASGAVALGSLSQTYDGSAKAATATTTPGGLAVSFTYNGSATVPTGAGSYTVIGTINDANYQGSATNTLVISKASSAIALGSLSQTYDGSAKAATATTTPGGLAVNLTYNGSATIPTAAGTYTVVATINDANYQGSATGTLMINTLMLTVTNLPALDKGYDGSTNATLDATNAGLAGVLNGDDVTLVTSNAVAYFADKNVGTNKPVTVTGLALVGAAAANYTLADPTNVTANVTVAGLTVGGITAVSKVYDATTNAQLNGTAALSGVVSGDDVSLVTGSASAAFAGPNVETGIPVTVSGYAITGADAGNYTLTQPSDLTADISAATLTITAPANTKIYDGTTSASAIPTTSGLQGSDTVTGLAETYDTPNAGTGKTLSVSAYTVNDGNSGNNYTVSTVTSTVGVIAKASASISLGSLNQTFNGSAEAATAATIPGELAVSFTYNGSATVPTSAGSYTVIGTINDANYQGSATGTLVINKVVLTVTADNKNKICGQPNPPLTVSYNGFVGGENANALSLPVVLNTTATNASGMGRYPITAGGATAANYTIQYVNGTLQVYSAPQVSGASVSVNGTRQYVVSCPTIAGQTYQLEYTTNNLASPKWTSLGTPFAGTDGMVAVTNSMSVAPRCFFRVEVLEAQ